MFKKNKTKRKKMAKKKRKKVCLSVEVEPQSINV